jgi:hypothetical protein
VSRISVYMNNSRNLALAFFLLSAAIRLYAAPCVNVELQQNHAKWQECLPVPQRTADRSWWALTAVSQAATIADIEVSVHELRQAGAAEANPLFGPHPGRARYYAVTEPLYALETYWSWRWKREDDGLRAAGYEGHRYLHWWIAPAVNIASHGVGVSVTLGTKP